MAEKTPPPLARGRGLASQWTFPYEDQRTLTTTPLRGEPRCFRSPNIVPLDHYRSAELEPGGVATRYAVGVGREEALNFRGSAVIGRKAEWPHWSPTADMIRRMRIYAHYVNGLPGGIGNPLGARALYLYRGNQDTDFRLHGTNEPDTIGAVQWMHTPVQPGHCRSLQPSSDWNAGRCAAGGGGARSGPVNPSVDANAIFVSFATTPRRADRSSQDASSPSQSSRARAPACVQA